MTNLKLTKRTSKTTFPIIRTVHAKLLAEDIVSVQALPLPEGRLFYMDIGETEEMRIIRYAKEELEAYTKEVDDYINDINRFKFVSPGISFIERDITIVDLTSRGIEYATDYSAHYTNRSLVDHGWPLLILDTAYVDMILEMENEKRIAHLIHEDFESYDHELIVYLN